LPPRHWRGITRYAAKLSRLLQLAANAANLKRFSVSNLTGYNNEVIIMAYETKTTLAAVYDILETSKNLEEAKRRVAKIANVEGVILRPSENAAYVGETDYHSES
jgi:hypothetical protein